MNVDSVSVVVKVKLRVDELDTVRLAGVLGVTAGAAVSTVKFQVWLAPVLLALSLHLTYQV
jgi:membrane glycosyltransferase